MRKTTIYKQYIQHIPPKMVRPRNVSLGSVDSDVTVREQVRHPYSGPDNEMNSFEQRLTEM